MFRWIRHHKDAHESGEVARRLHSAWLSRAIAREQEYPRIPIRRVDEGGFAVLMGTAYGPQLSEAWWRMALDRVDSIEDPADKR